MKKLVLYGTISLVLASCGASSKEIKPEYRAITETVFASGILEPEGKYNLAALSDGYIKGLNFSEGSLIKAGDLLAVIDNQQNAISERAAQDLYEISKNNASAQAPALKQAEASIELAKEKLQQDEVQLARFKKLYESNSISKLELENMQLAVANSKTALFNAQQAYKVLKIQADQQVINQESQRNTFAYLSGNNGIRAAVGGKVYRKMKENGDFVRKGDLIAMIGSADEIYAKINIDESNIGKIKIGQKVIIQLNTDKERRFNGTLYEILPAFDEATQSFICKVKFDEELPLKISGTQLQVNVIIGKKEKALVIPRSYLDYGNKVMVKGKDEAVIVKTGFVSNEWVEIISGLSANDVLEEPLK